MHRVLFPRLHPAEIEDQSWCPEFLRTHTHRALARTWKTSTSKKKSPALQASKILIQELEGLSNTTEYSFVDSCARAGGPTPIVEPALNKQLRAAGFNSVQFKLTDLWPDLKAWREIASKNENISYVEEPVDATKAKRLSGDKKECRLYNLCFHHFDNDAAEKVLSSAVESSDAFLYVVIYFHSFFLELFTYMCIKHLRTYPSNSPCLAQHHPYHPLALYHDSLRLVVVTFSLDLHVPDPAYPNFLRL